MSFHIVASNRTPYKAGTIFECFDDGCQEAIMETVDNRMHVLGHKGLLLPFDTIREYTIPILRKGFSGDPGAGTNYGLHRADKK